MKPREIQPGKRYVVKTSCPAEVVTTIRRASGTNGWRCRDDGGYELIVLVTEFIGTAEESLTDERGRIAA